MNMRTNLLSAFLFSILGLSLKAQTLFLPSNLSTSNVEHIQDFAEGKSGNYFFAGRHNTGSIDSGTSVTNGVVYKTNANGSLLKQFFLNGQLNSYGIIFEGIHIKDDAVFVVATKITKINGQEYGNRILLLKLDTELNLISIDSVLIDVETTNAQVVKTIIIDDRIVIGIHAPGTQSVNSPLQNSFLLLFDLEGKNVRKQRITNTLVPDNMIADRFWLCSITPQKNGLFSLNGWFERNDPVLPIACIGMTLDTALNMQSRILLNTLQRPSTDYDLVFGNNEVWKPTPTSSSFFGPMIDSGSQAPYTVATLSKIKKSSNSFQSAPLLQIPSATGRDRLTGFKRPMALSRDNKAFTLLTTDRCDRIFQDDVCALYVTQYDTSLNLRWSRSFQQPNTSFIPFGVYELSNKNLMILASSYNFQRTPTTYYDLYAFVLDSNGTPLRVFDLPGTPSKVVKVYPNPTTNSIQFEFPNTVSGRGCYILRNTSGSVVQQGVYESYAPIEISNLSVGIYFYQLQTENKEVFSGCFSKE